MLRLSRVNSKDSTRQEDLNDLIEDFIKCGYNQEKLHKIKDDILHPEDDILAEELRGLDKEGQSDFTEQKSPLIFICEYFKDIDKLKTFLNSLGDDLNKLIGSTKIMVACRKGPNIGNMVVKNRSLGEIDKEPNNRGQKCGARNCKTCSVMLEESEISCNGISLKLPKNVNCKTSNVIYGDLCQDAICVQRGENLYVGQTFQPLNKRNNGHRGCFNDNDFEKSALATHAKLDHNFMIDFDNFKCAILKKTSHLNLDREEYKFTERLRTNVLGLNRCKIVRE